MGIKNGLICNECLHKDICRHAEFAKAVAEELHRFVESRDGLRVQLGSESKGPLYLNGNLVICDSFRKKRAQLPTNNGDVVLYRGKIDPNTPVTVEAENEEEASFRRWNELTGN